MFTQKGIRDFISKGFRTTTQKQKEFESDFQSTSERIETGRKEMKERSNNRKIIRNK